MASYVGSDMYTYSIEARFNLGFTTSNACNVVISQAWKLSFHIDKFFVKYENSCHTRFSS